MLAELQDASFRVDLAAADSICAAMIARWPDDPVGYYGRAVHEQARSLGCEGSRSAAPLDADLEAATERGLVRLRAFPDDVWTRYLVGLALGFQSLRAMERGWPWRAYRLGTRSLDHLYDVLRRDSTFADAWLPIGTYHLWRGVALARWTWLPFVDDTRDQGLHELRRAAREGRITAVSAKSMLVWALQPVGRHGEALALADSLVREYPRNRSFLWARAEALKALGRWDQAEVAFAGVVASFGPEDDACPGLVTVRSTRAMALVELGRCDEARPLLEAALTYRPPDAAARDYDAVRRAARSYLSRCECAAQEER